MTEKFSSSGFGTGAMRQQHRQGGDRVLKQAVTGLADHYLASAAAEQQPPTPSGTSRHAILVLKQVHCIAVFC